MKKGISLIVLVITIIVMIILAASVVVTLSNTGIIDRASQAVQITNESQARDLATMIWADAYMNNLRDQALVDEVKNKLKEQGIEDENWDITVSNTGVNIMSKDNVSNVHQPGTLGYLIGSAANYGKTINYEANGITNWKVFYHTNEYVYLIASEKIPQDKIPASLIDVGATIESSTITIADNTTREVGQLYWWMSPSNYGTIQNPSLWMADFGDYVTNRNGRVVSYLLDETHWTAFKNTTAPYSSHIVGSIGTPTIEMFVASWNAKRAATNNTSLYNKKLALVKKGTDGYYINDITNGEAGVSNATQQSISTGDKLYFWDTVEKSGVWLAGSSAYTDTYCLYSISADGRVVTTAQSGASYGVRPVVCLKATTPATIGTTTDFEI